MSENKNTQVVIDHNVFKKLNTVNEETDEYNSKFKQLTNRYNNKKYVNDSSFYTFYRRVIASKHRNTNK
jgi:hypothetical protein